MINCNEELVRGKDGPFINGICLHHKYSIQNNEKLIMNFFDNSITELKRANDGINANIKSMPNTNIIFLLTDKNPQILTDIRNNHATLFKNFFNLFADYYKNLSEEPKNKYFNNFKVIFTREVNEYYNSLRLLGQEKSLNQGAKISITAMPE